MSTWTAAAREELDRYFGRVRPALAASGADAGEVIDDLRRHLEQEVAASQLQVVTEQDVRRLLARIGAPEPPVAGGSGGGRPAVPGSTPEAPAAAPVPAPVNPLGRGANAFVVGAGIVLPIISLFIEWLTGMCAGAFFDPIPSVGHLLLLAAVPLVNWQLWRAVRQEKLLAGRRPAWLGWIGGATIGVELYYAIVFVPLLLPGLLAVILYGWGLLPWSPTLALVATLFLMRRLRLQQAHAGPAAARGAGLRGAWPGFGIGLALLAALESGEALTRYALTLATDEDPAAVRRGIQLLRSWGDREVLLRDCYGRTRAAQNMDLMGWVITGGRSPRPEVAREVYYRVTGQPFNSVPAPRIRTARARWAALDDWTWDRDQAGQQVGGRVKGLTMHSSRMDALVEPGPALAYYEWTMEFKNDSPRQREARSQILLPPGGVVSRLTLWVNGEEREAAFAGRGQVREAYEKIVRRRQDPVLVTTAGPDRILVQCFPVPPDGGVMKLRLGITAPLGLRTPDKALVRWPVLIERNFTIREEFRHSLWVEGPGTLAGSGSLFRTEEPRPGWHAARALVREVDLASAASFLEVARDGAVREAWVRDTRGAQPGLVRQSLREAPGRNPGRIVLVVDGSAGMGDYSDLSTAVAGLPAAPETTVIVAGDEPALLGSAGQETGARLFRWKALGGQDNVPALVQAWDLAAEKPDSVVVWVHGPVPVLLQSVEPLRQRYERRPNGPRLVELQTETGPNRILEQLDGIAAVESWPRTGSLANDLKALIQSWTGGGAHWEWVRQRVADGEASPSGAAEASLHLARLWAKDEIRRLTVARKIEAAVALAGRYQLVTPVSGAVVLETAQQYQESGLEPVPASTVPSIPEPSTWALLALGGAVLAFRRRRRTA